MVQRTLIWSFTAVVLGGCGPAPPDVVVPDEATDCIVGSASEPSEVRAVESGDAAGEDFVPYADGASVSLVQGGQGLLMITPWVRVAAEPADGDEGCFVVRLEHEFLGELASDENANGGSQLNVHFVRAGSFLISDGAIYHPFTVDRQVPPGEKLRLRTLVTGKDFTGETTVTIALE